MHRIQNINSILPYLGLCIFSYLFVESILQTLYADMTKTVILITLSPLFFIFLYVQSKVGIERLFQYSLFFFWFPVPFVLSKYIIFKNILLFEAIIWFFFIFIIANKTNVRGRLKQFPYVPFLVYISGALLTFFFSSHRTGLEISTIRLLCIFPMFFCMTIFVSTTSSKDINHLFWVMLISGTCLSILFSFGPKSLSFVQETDYAVGLGRLSMQFDLPYMGEIRILPTTIGTVLSFLSIIAYNYWLFNTNRLTNMFSIVAIIIFTVSFVFAQARGASVAFIVSCLAITTIGMKIGIVPKRTALIKLTIPLLILVAGSVYFAIQSENIQIYDRLFTLLHEPTSDTNYLGRLERWEEGLITILKDPLGVGLWGFHTSPDGDSWDVHNLWLFLGLSYGIIGLFGFVWILICFLKVFIKGLKNKDLLIQQLSLTGMGMIIVIVIAGMFSPLVWEPYTVTPFWVPMTALFALIKSVQERST